MSEVKFVGKPWFKKNSSTKNSNENFWVFRQNCENGMFSFTYQFSKVDSASNWITKIDNIKWKGGENKELLNKAIKYAKENLIS